MIPKEEFARWRLDAFQGKTELRIPARVGFFWANLTQVQRDTFAAIAAKAKPGDMVIPPDDWVRGNMCLPEDGAEGRVDGYPVYWNNGWLRWVGDREDDGAVGGFLVPPGRAEEVMRIVRQYGVVRRQTRKP